MLKYLFWLSITIVFLSCNKQVQTEPKKTVNRDLTEIKNSDTLKAMVTYSATSYFLYRGQPMGYEYELLKRLGKQLDVNIEIKVTQNLNNMLEALNNGEVDIVAHGLAVTSERKQKVSFTDYLYLTQQVLVQKKPDNWRQLSWAETQKSLIHDAIELIGDTVAVRANSSYLKRLQNLSKEIGGKIHIDTLNGNLSTDEIIQMVVDGKIKYTIADKNLAQINASYYPVLNIDVPVSFSQRIAWAVRDNSPELLDSVNKWIKHERKDAVYYVIYNKYFKNKRDFRRRIKSDFYSLNKNQISQYDPIIKRNAENLNWDWRLLASLIYQESRFKPSAKSWAGAKGLMQMMPATAKEMGVKNRSNPEDNIRGGTKYLKHLYNNFDEIEDTVQRIKFAMASYNCGYMHVRDAQRLAEENSLDKHLWTNNVDSMILALSYPKNYNKDFIRYGYVRGIEPFKYVNQIFERFEHYKKFITLIE